jgi:hypothetical protein
VLTEVFELEIASIESISQNIVKMIINFEDYPQIYVEFTHNRSENTGYVSFFTPFSFLLKSSEFEVFDPEMDEKGAENAILDWFLTKNGVKNIEIACNAIKRLGKNK